ncbi:tRNA-intron lyase [Candidatus Bathyarchaeota archaeon]|nr:tRNA-intron lyase [Candidatus Bathyarchaeota archaeon]
MPVQLLGDNRLIVWDHKKGNQLYNKGFYGKPLGVARPREEFTQPLILDAVEGLYLLEKKMITVCDLLGKTVSLSELRRRLQEETDGIERKYGVYNELREKGYIVTPGIKYGCDFAVYEHGPGIDHAPYVIQLQGSDEPIEAEEIVKSGRLASTVRKSFIKAVKIGGESRFLEFNWWKA